MNSKQKIFSVAPMMDWTDRYCRFFHRQLSAHTVLYTEMVTAGAVVHGDRDHLIGFDDTEHPVVLQLGGSDPIELAKAAQIAEQYGYDEINLNVGCPSDRVKSGNFGAALMLDPQLVAACIDEMADAVSIPVTVKCRIGVDDQDEDEDLERFVKTVASGGCNKFIVHARKAWLSGLSPKQNRDVPPLNYQRVYRLKQSRPDLEIHINGGIEDLDQAQQHFERVDGVMLGRAAYHQPFILAKIDNMICGKADIVTSRIEAVEKMYPFIAEQLGRGVRLPQITRHMLGLFHAQPRARLWRRYLAENAHLENAGIDVLKRALDIIS